MDIVEVNLYIFMKNSLPKDGIDLELCNLLGIDLAMKEEVIEEHEEGMKEHKEGKEERKKSVEEQEEILDKHKEEFREHEKIMGEQEERIGKENADEVFSVPTHGMQYAFGENINIYSFNYAASQSDKGPKVGAKKRGCPKKIRFERTQLIKDDL